MLCAIVLTRTAIMLEHVLHVNELYVREWHVVVDLEVYSWWRQNWRLAGVTTYTNDLFSNLCHEEST